MRNRQWSLCDLLIAVVLALIVVAEVMLALKIVQVDAESAQVEAVMEEAQARIDAYYASLPARERPVMVSAAPVVGVKEAEEPETPEWYIDGIPLEPELQETLWNACQEFGVDYPLALAVIEQETDFSNIQGDGGRSIGYFQIQPRWWGELMEEIGAADLSDPEDNFRTGCAVLAQLLRQYEGSVTDALTAYNTGRPGASAYAGAVLETAERWEEQQHGRR